MRQFYKFSSALLPLIVLIGATPSAFAQPINDSVFMSVSLINAPTGGGSTNVGATAEPDNNPSASCTSNDGDNSVWWWFAASSSGNVTIDLSGSNFDTVLALFDSGLSEVACNDDAGGTLQSRIENFSAVAGAHYFMRVSGFAGAQGDITYSINGPITAPPEDNVALIMVPTGTYPMTTIGATAGGPLPVDPLATCTTNDGGNSIYRSFRGDGGTVTLFFENAGFDTIMTILDASGNELDCDDDGGEGTRSRIDDFPTAPNVTYWVRISGFAGEEGNARLRFNRNPPTANEDTTVPEVIALDAAYPNPFAARTTLPYFLPEAQQVRVVAYDVLGREIAVLAEGVRTAGQHEATFDAASLPSGLYVIRLTAGKTNLTRRVTVVR